MGAYRVMAEEVSTHTVVVEADNEDEAADKYFKGDFTRDLGYTYDVDSGLILSAEEVQ